MSDRDRTTDRTILWDDMRLPMAHLANVVGVVNRSGGYSLGEKIYARD